MSLSPRRSSDLPATIRRLQAAVVRLQAGQRQLAQRVAPAPVVVPLPEGGAAPAAPTVRTRLGNVVVTRAPVGDGSTVVRTRVHRAPVAYAVPTPDTYVGDLYADDAELVLSATPGETLHVFTEDVSGAGEVSVQSASAVLTVAPVVTADLSTSVLASIDTAGAKADAAQIDAAAAAAAAAAANTAAANASTAAGAAQTTADSKGKTIFQPSAPTGANADVKNLWINTSGTPPLNRPYRFDVTSSSWVAVTDKAATDAAAAAVAAQAAADAATAAASTAQTSANGKNRIVYSGANAAGAGQSGDVWFKITAGVIVGQWVHDGTGWVSTQIDGARLTNLDAASITTGLLNVAVLIQAGAIDVSKLAAEVIQAGSVYSAQAYLGTLTADQLVANQALVGALQVVDLVANNVLVQANMVANTLTVLGQMTARAVFEVAQTGRIILRSGTTLPTTPLTVVSGYDTVPVVSDGIAGSYGAGNHFYNGAWWVGGTDAAGIGRVTRVDAVTGAQTRNGLANSFVARYPVRVGTKWYVCSRPGFNDVYRYSDTWVLEVGISPAGAFATLATDGTDLYTAALSSARQVEFRRYTTAGVQVGATITGDRVYPAGWTVESLLYGTFDLGVQRYVVGLRNAVGTYVTNVYTTAGVWLPGDGFDLAGSGQVGWDGTQFWSVGQTTLSKHTPITDITPTPWRLASVWWDSVAGKETALGPVTDFTPVKRSRLQVTGATPPAGLRFRVYAAKGAGVVPNSRQADPAAGAATVTYSTVTFTGPAVGAGSTPFVASGAGATVEGDGGVFIDAAGGWPDSPLKTNVRNDIAARIASTTATPLRDSVDARVTAVAPTPTLASLGMQRGSGAYTTVTGGDITIPHTLGVVPVSSPAQLQNAAGTARTVRRVPGSTTATQVVYRCFDAAGNPLGAGTVINVDWLVIA